MPEIPEKRQSIRPRLPVLLGALGTVLVMAVIWFAVTWAVGAGGEDCASKPANGAASDRCR
jgi:hypothetical protein